MFISNNEECPFPSVYLLRRWFHGYRGQKYAFSWDFLRLGSPHGASPLSFSMEPLLFIVCGLVARALALPMLLIAIWKINYYFRFVFAHVSLSPWMNKKNIAHLSPKQRVKEERTRNIIQWRAARPISGHTEGFLSTSKLLWSARLRIVEYQKVDSKVHPPPYHRHESIYPDMLLQTHFYSLHNLIFSM